MEEIRRMLALPGVRIFRGGRGIISYCSRANLPAYKDTRDTILIIDEIQTSAEIYNSLRDLKRSLNCDIAVTGSYLGVVFG